MSYKKKNKFVLNDLEILVNKLRKEKMPVDSFLELLSKTESSFFQNPQLELELLLSNGLPLEINEDNIFLKTSLTSIKNQSFCVVDIETNGSNIRCGQIIEIGAVKYKNGEIVETYDSLIYAKDIPSYIQEVTRIVPLMLENAPRLQTVLEEFKIFLEDDVFIAHDIKFDYKFISDSLEKYNLGKLQNRKMCTIDLAKRTIFAQRYGLDFLKELLDIDMHQQHRALNDALSTTHILQRCLQNLPQEVKTTEDLIGFSKSDNILKSK